MKTLTLANTINSEKEAGKHIKEPDVPILTIRFKYESQKH